MALCRECALSMGVRAQVEAFQRLSQLLMQDLASTGIPDEMRAAMAAKCSHCGLVFQEFVQTGLLGCPTCYDDFKDLLKPVLRRMHGVIKQSGDAPEHRKQPAEAKENAKEQLEMELHLALLEENYEKAAALRDKLKQLPPVGNSESSPDSMN